MWWWKRWRRSGSGMSLARVEWWRWWLSAQPPRQSVEEAAAGGREARELAGVLEREYEWEMRMARSEGWVLPSFEEWLERQVADLEARQRAGEPTKVEVWKAAIALLPGMGRRLVWPGGRVEAVEVPSLLGRVGHRECVVAAAGGRPCRLSTTSEMDEE